VTIFAAAFRVLDGTLLNAGTILCGGVLGILLGNRLPEHIQETLFAAIGLVTVLIGLLNAWTTHNPLIVLISMLAGGLIGEIVGIEQALTRLGDWLQKRLSRPGSTFSEGFVTASLVFCVGPLSILGALNNGLTGDLTDLAIKATMDGIAAVAFAATLGWGVLASLATILAYQGSISIGAHGLKPLVDANPAAITELNAVGGLVLVAIGLKLLKLRDLRVANFLPALVVAPLLAAFLAHAPHLLP
jgi:uncharacterized protein